MYQISLKFLSYVPKTYNLDNFVRFKIQLTNESKETIKNRWVEIGVSTLDDEGSYNKKNSFTVYVKRLEPNESISVVSPYPGWYVSKKEFNIQLSIDNIFSSTEFISDTTTFNGLAIEKPSSNPMTNSLIQKSQETLYQYVGFSAVVLGILTAITVWKNIIQPLVETHQESISYTAEQSRKFYILLAKIQALTNADRVVLLQSYTEAGSRSNLNLKPTHEVVSQGIDYCSPDIGLISPFCVTQIIESLSSKDLRCRIAQFTDTDIYKNFLENIGVLATCSYLLESNDIPLGVLVLHYCKDVDQMSKASLKQIEPSCRELTNLLSKKRTGGLSTILDIIMKYSPFQ